jgi:uncharacterized protein (DUF58 family)
MTGFYKQLFLPARFFILGSVIIVVFGFSFVIHWLFPLGQSLLLLLIAITAVDGVLLFAKKELVRAERKVQDIISLGDENKIFINLKNISSLKLNISIYDDLPYQLQKRNLKLESSIDKEKEKTFEYIITPKRRGEYVFGNINVIASTGIGLVCRKVVVEAKQSVHVYPSIIQMKKFGLKAPLLYTTNQGIKRMRRIGHTYEFEQIKEYVTGDDSRTINWKASSRRATLMVNQYEDERAQQIYSIIDKSRIMKMSFNGLSLLDYSINASLVLSNITLQKHDKAGLITFSDKIGTIIPAEKNELQLKKIFEALYNEKEYFLEAEYELLYHIIRKVIKNKSLIFLYTNFESIQAFERVLPILRQINKYHQLVVIFFENEEVAELSKKPANKLFDIYVKTMAKKYLFDKNQVKTELNNHGIQCIKTLPEELSIHTINKYLELKSRGLA